MKPGDLVHINPHLEAKLYPAWGMGEPDGHSAGPAACGVAVVLEVSDGLRAGCRVVTTSGLSGWTYMAFLEVLE